MSEMNKKQKKEIKDILQELLNKDKMQDYLDFYSHHCSKYSLLNTLRIFAQRPTSTYVAGRKQWREKGRIIKDNEKPMTLFAPKFEWETINGKKVKILKDWTKIEVFDISQTTLEGVDVEITGFSLNLFENDNAEFLFKSYVGKTNLNVILLDETEMIEKFGVGCTGFIEYDKKNLYIQKAAPTQMLKTLFHEMAHFELKHNELTIPQSEKEIEAELASYVCCKYLSIDVENLSMPYIASWLNASEDKQIKYNLERIEKFVKYFSAL